MSLASLLGGSQLTSPACQSQLSELTPIAKACGITATASGTWALPSTGLTQIAQCFCSATNQPALTALAAACLSSGSLLTSATAEITTVCQNINTNPTCQSTLPSLLPTATQCLPTGLSTSLTAAQQCLCQSANTASATSFMNACTDAGGFWGVEVNAICPGSKAGVAAVLPSAGVDGEVVGVLASGAGRAGYGVVAGAMVLLFSP
ncbi:hypothetical protein HDU98_000095 [Podochytrium sp. JEL0797]|nr:hypothetical protein HDU98_000095 [Podochytrium sp. JEL0797]